MSYLKLSKQWRIQEKNQELVIFGGEDAIYTIDLDGGSHSFFATLKHGQPFAKKDLTIQDQLVLEQLLSAGVVTPVLATRHRGLRVKLVEGKPILAGLLSIKNIETSSEKDCDLLVLVRTNETLGDFLRVNRYLKILKPHVFVDLAFNHVISLGPLVFPGTTACVACLEGRLANRWGDDTPPLQPKASIELGGLAAEWVALELQKICHNDNYSLINKTVVLDVANHTLNTYRLLSVPLCPYCKKDRLLSGGKLGYNSA